VTPALGLCLAVPPLELAAHRRLAVRGEHAGAAVLAVGEARHDSFATAAMVACSTSTTPVLTAVTTWVRSPVATARAARTLAELSGGRFTLGLGTMPPAWNRERHGIEVKRPLARLSEYVAVVRAAAAAWAGAPVRFEGEFFTVTGYGDEIASPPGHPVPVYLGVTRPATARLAAEIADGAVVNIVHTGQWLRDRLVPATGGIPRVVMLRVVVHDGSPAGRAGALREAREALTPYRPIPYFREIAHAEGLDPDELDDERLLSRFTAIGTLDEVRARVAEYAGLADVVLLAPPATLAPSRSAFCYDALLTLLPRPAPGPRGDG